MPQLLAGVAKIVITPPVGIDLTGFGNRSGPASSVHDDLRAAALYLESNVPLLIMTSDLIGLDDASVAEIRAGIAEQMPIPAANIMIGCSHTHSGPATPCLNYLGKVDRDYFTILKHKLIGLGKLAFNNRQPAALGHLREPVSIGANRRKLVDGQMQMIPNDAGAIAAWVDVVAVDTMAGLPLARYFVNATHAVTVSGLELSADWPGYAQRIVERIYGDGCIALFGQGCCGNINSDPRGTFEIAERQGRIMAGAVVKAAEYCTKYPEVTLGAASEVLPLPCFDPPSVEAAEALVAQARQQAADPANNYGVQMMADGNLEWTERIVALAQAGATGLTRNCEVQAFRLGEFGLVGLPGEVFVEYALNIDAHAGYQQTATMAYTNGNIGYIPDAQAYPDGGYEVEHAIRFYGDTMLTPESEKLILDSALGLLQQLH
ncbi:MAG: hypothetical protein WCP21_15010 [Armatimonadota bacterium]